ncbi:hypothetical protein OEZ85_007187 [Tetradesmus obliquus]|uniref:FBD domain-containing protein n=1 Tax=Tetradesmus obliquus TaxID=3088 RepID=A0ABY8U1R7_TETOB|nr:hypothetical protein OEZ85_007187 [Tetradesmus obliquus]
MEVAGPRMADDAQHLQRLQLVARDPAALLRQLQPSRLSSLVLTLDDAAAESQLLAAALSRLTGLQELRIISEYVDGDTAQPHVSFAAALARMPQLTQLVMQPQLPAAALARLPRQLVHLHLSAPDCSAAELVAHVNALPQLQTLKLAYGSGAVFDVPARNVAMQHAAAWGAIPALRQLDLRLAMGLDAATLGGIAAATNLTRLVGHFLHGEPGARMSMLSSLQQLEALQLSFTPFNPNEA